MARQQDANLTLHPTGRIARWCAIAATFGAAAAILSVWPVSASAPANVLLGLGCVLAGIAAQTGLAVLIRPRDTRTWAMTALATQAFRLGVSIVLAMWCQVVYTPDRLGFWSGFLAASFAAIAGEAAALVTAARSFDRPLEQTDRLEFAPQDARANHGENDR